MGKIPGKPLNVFKQKIYLSKNSDLNFWPKTQRGSFPKMESKTVSLILLTAQAVWSKIFFCTKKPCSEVLKKNQQTHKQHKQGKQHTKKSVSLF